MYIHKHIYIYICIHTHTHTHTHTQVWASEAGGIRAERPDPSGMPVGLFYSRSWSLYLYRRSPLLLH